MQNIPSSVIRYFEYGDIAKKDKEFRLSNLPSTDRCHFIDNIIKNGFPYDQTLSYKPNPLFFTEATHFIMGKNFYDILCIIYFLSGSLKIDRFIPIPITNILYKKIIIYILRVFFNIMKSAIRI